MRCFLIVVLCSYTSNAYIHLSPKIYSAKLSSLTKLEVSSKPDFVSYIARPPRSSKLPVYASSQDSEVQVQMPDTSSAAVSSVEQKLKSKYPIFDRDPSSTPPPKSFQMCVEQAFLSTKAAIDKGYRLLEVEFPPLPSKALENGALGADVISSAQIDHAKEFARLFEGKRVAIVFPDIEERNRFIQDTSFSTSSSTGNFRFSALGGGFKGGWIERLWVKQARRQPEILKCCLKCFERGKGFDTNAQS